MKYHDSFCHGRICGGARGDAAPPDSGNFRAKIRANRRGEKKKEKKEKGEKRKERKKEIGWLCLILV